MKSAFLSITMVTAMVANASYFGENMAPRLTPPPAPASQPSWAGAAWNFVSGVACGAAQAIQNKLDGVSKTGKWVLGAVATTAVISTGCIAYKLAQAVGKKRAIAREKAKAEELNEAIAFIHSWDPNKQETKETPAPSWFPWNKAKQVLKTATITSVIVGAGVGFVKYVVPFVTSKLSSKQPPVTSPAPAA